MAASTELQFLITADDEASAKLNGLSDTLKANREGLLAVGAAAGIAFAGIVGFAKNAIDAANESANVQAQLTAALTSTHGAAGLYIEDLNDQAQALQKMTTYSDEAIGSAQALLLTFTNIKGSVFQEATGTILDMSTALGEDLKSASIQVGKALNDPITGITALQRVGVTFTDSQKAVIKSLVDTGQTAKAQQIILDELNREFGGSAVAAGQTFSGQMAIINNQIDEVNESVGRALIPVLQTLSAQILPVVEKLAGWAEENPELIRNILLFGGAITGVIAILATLGLVLPTIIAGFELMLGPIGLVIIAFALITAAVIAFHSQIATFFLDLNAKTGIITFFKEAWDAVEIVFQENLMPALTKLWAALQPLLPFLQAMGQVIGFTLVAALYLFIAVLAGTIILLTQLLTWLVEIETFLVGLFSDALNSVIGLVSGFISAWPKLLAQIQSFVSSAVAFFQPFINMLDTVASKISAVGSAIGNAASAVGGSVSGVVHAVIPHAAGGSVSPFSTYLVGENGPELFRSDVGGSIIPNSQLAGAGGQNISISINGAIFSAEAADRLGAIIMQQLRFKTRIGT